jgi:superfamily II DNA or RNA helicase
VAIILTTSSNMNQIVQRIGRTIRKTTGKDTALIYTIYLSCTHDSSTLKMVRQAKDVLHERKSPSIDRGNLDRYIL